MVKVMVGRRGCKALEDTVLAIKVLTAFMSCLCAYGIFQHISCFSRNGACARYALSKTFDRENSRTWLHIYVHVTPLSRDTLYINCNCCGRKPHIGKESMPERLSLLRRDSPDELPCSCRALAATQACLGTSTSILECHNSGYIPHARLVSLWLGNKLQW